VDTPQLIKHLKTSLQEIPHLKSIKKGTNDPHVKAWKTRLEELLTEGGSACGKTLASLRNMRSAFSGSEFIKEQTYITHMDAMERSLKQAIQTIEVFGRPEDNNILPHWGKPKSQLRAVGNLMVGDEEVATDAISIHEVLDCLVSLTEDSNDLTEQMRETLVNNLNNILFDDLLQPFLSRKMDVLLGHWPEFQTK